MHERITPRHYKLRPVETLCTAFRDGLQDPRWHDFGRIYPTTDEIVELARAEMIFGVRLFELFSPNVSERAAADLNAVIQVRDELEPQLGHPVFIFCHGRTHPADIDAALKAGADGLNLYRGTSPISLKYKEGKELTVEQVGTDARKQIEDIRRTHPDLWIRFSGEDAYRTPPEHLYEIYDKVAPFVNALGSPDTVGAAYPEQVEERTYLLQEKYPKIYLEGHFQNDGGLSLANALAAIKAGMRLIDTSILGIAERSGITSITALLLNVYRRWPEKFEGFEKSLAYKLNTILADIIGMQVPSTEPVSASNRTHSAGVHTNAVLFNRNTYEDFHLEEWGVEESKLLIGALTGKHTIDYYLKYFLNCSEVPPLVLDQITSEFKNRCANIKKGEGTSKTPRRILESLVKKYDLKVIEKPRTNFENLEGF